MNMPKIYNRQGIELLRVSKEELDAMPDTYGLPCWYAISDDEIYVQPLEEINVIKTGIREYLGGKEC